MMNLSIYHEPNKIVWYYPDLGDPVFKVKVTGIQILGPDIVNYIVTLYNEGYHYQTGKNYLTQKDYFYDSFIVPSTRIKYII